jgi:type II secretory pathway predicted ATPase ExeA
MQAEQSRLAEGAFGPEVRPVVTVKYQAFVEALTFLRGVLRQPDSIGVLHGPEMAGKSTIVRDLGAALGRTMSVAVVDADKLNPIELLTEVLAQFGYDTGLDSTDELLKMIGVFSAQQLRAREAPVVIIENIDRAFPSTRTTTNALASMTTQNRFALRLLMTSRTAGVSGVPSRNVHSHALGPLTPNESMHYLYSRLQAVGLKHPDAIIPMNVCDRLFENSGGWPGLLNKAARSELSPALPRLVLTRDGETLLDYTFRERKVVIGRSGFADIVVPDPFASKLHAMMLLYSDALVLIDLNSANGTTVNSKQVKSTVLRDNDVISFGHHRLKVLSAPLVSPEIAEALDKADTVKMKTLVEARRRLEARQRPITLRR